MLVTQSPRRSPIPLSAVLRSMKQKMPVPTIATSQQTATELMARLRLRRRSETISYTSVRIPNTIYSSVSTAHGCLVSQQHYQEKTNRKEGGKEDINPRCWLRPPGTVKPSNEAKRGYFEQGGYEASDDLSPVELEPKSPKRLDMWNSSSSFFIKLRALSLSSMR